MKLTFLALALVNAFAAIPASARYKDVDYDKSAISREASESTRLTLEYSQGTATVTKGQIFVKNPDSDYAILRQGTDGYYYIGFPFLSGPQAGKVGYSRYNQKNCTEQQAIDFAIEFLWTRAHPRFPDSGNG